MKKKILKIWYDAELENGYGRNIATIEEYGLEGPT